MKTNSIKRNTVLAILCFLATGTAFAGGRCAPEVHGGWIRLTPGGMGMLAGYARVVNPCPTEATLTRTSSASFAYTSLHETTLDNGVSHMRSVPSLHIAANAAVALKPGGLHLMLMQPAVALKAGDQVSIVFTLNDGRTITGKFTVRAADLP